MEGAKVDNKKNIIIAVVLVALAVGGYFYFGGNNLGDNVATVNGKNISMETYNTQLNSAIEIYKNQGVDVANAEKLSQIRAEVLDGLVNNELISQKILEAGIKATPEDIEKQFQLILTQVGGAEGLNAELVKNNITEAQLRENIANQFAIQTYLSQNIDLKSVAVADKEIIEFYGNYTKTQKENGQENIPTIDELAPQIKQQIISDKQQVLIKDFIASLRSKAEIKTITI